MRAEAGAGRAVMQSCFFLHRDTSRLLTLFMRNVMRGWVAPGLHGSQGVIFELTQGSRLKISRFNRQYPNGSRACAHDVAG